MQDAILLIVIFHRVILLIVTLLSVPSNGCHSHMCHSTGCHDATVRNGWKFKSYLKIVRIEEDGIGDVQLSGHNVGDVVGQPGAIILKLFLS
jgi:hypothetical protein